MNPVGLLGLQLLNSGNSNPARRTERLFKDLQPPHWRNSGKFPLYRWYYQTQAVFQSEKGRGKRWKEWNENLKTELTVNQLGNGSWNLPGGDNSYRVKDKKDLSIYSTGLCALMLQVYYRYLPGYSIAEASKSKADIDELDLGGAGLITRLPGGADPMAAVLLGMGETEMKPIKFGNFDGTPETPSEPHIKEEFTVYASFKSTIPIRKPTDWPQTLQPNQRIALFFDDLLPKNFKGHLRLQLGLIGNEKAAADFKLSMEAVINGKRLYNSYLLRKKQLVELIIPSEYLQPFGNICQLRNNGKDVLAFDAAELASIEKLGKPLRLLSDATEVLPKRLNVSFQTEASGSFKVCKLSSTSESRQLLSEIKEYTAKETYIAEWYASGNESMGNEFQHYYLCQAGREIVEWLAGGGDGVRLKKISTGGKYYDSVFRTEYPALSALRQTAKLFEGSPRKLTAQIYPVYGEKPLFYTSAAASYNAPGVATIVAAKRFPVPEETGITVIIPWSGKTTLIQQKGFLDENSPFSWIAPRIERSEQEINIENNTFRFSGILPELTVIRLVRKGSRNLPESPAEKSVTEPEVKYDYTTVKVVPAEQNLKLKEKVIRTSDGFFSIFGRNGSCAKIPATVPEGKNEKFSPPEAQSLEVSFRANAHEANRFDSIYLNLGNGPNKPQFLSLYIYGRCSGLKKREHLSRIPFRFSLNETVFEVPVSIGHWQRLLVPLKDRNIYWKAFRILEPGRILNKNINSVSYEINNITVLYP